MTITSSTSPDQRLGRVVGGHRVGQRTSVLLVEEYAANSELIAHFLEHQVGELIQVLGTVPNLEAAGEVCREMLPDVIVFEPLTTEIAPVELVTRLLTVSPKAKLFAFTRSCSVELATEMRNAGVRGAITRRRPLSEFVVAIRCVSGGDLYFEEDLTEKNSYQIPRLTAREKQVVAMISNGLSTKEIATQMDVTPSTVNKFRQAAMDKLGTHDAASVTRYAIRAGLSVGA